MMSKLGAGLTAKKSFYMAEVSEIVRREGWNPRFDFGDMEAMIGSVTALGVKNPLWVKRNEEGKLVIIDGDRRFTAVEKANEKGAGITEVPVRILDKDTADSEALILALTANESKPLTPLEEASAYKRLVEELQCSAAELAKKLGRSEAHVKDRMSLLGASPAVQAAVGDGKLGTTLAENIVGHTADHSEQARLAEDAMSGREGKQRVQEAVQAPRRQRQPRVQQEAPQVAAPTSAALDDQLQTLEMGQMADLTVLVQRQGFKVAAGALSDEELEALITTAPALDQTYDPALRDIMMTMFRLGTVMGLRASRGKKFNLLP
jgi:ParB/RepB/Spo0J family partition protein